MATTVNNTNALYPDRGSMDSVTMKKEHLLAALEVNRATHRSTFEKALEGYRTRAVELLEDHIARIKNNKVEQVFVSLPLPEDHSDEYDRAIASLNYAVQDEIEVSMREFDQFVLDNWAWKKEWTLSNSVYTK